MACASEHRNAAKTRNWHLTRLSRNFACRGGNLPPVDFMGLAHCRCSHKIFLTHKPNCSILKWGMLTSPCFCIVAGFAETFTAFGRIPCRGELCSSALFNHPLFCIHLRWSSTASLCHLRWGSVASLCSIMVCRKSATAFGRIPCRGELFISAQPQRKCRPQGCCRSARVRKARGAIISFNGQHGSGKPPEQKYRFKWSSRTDSHPPEA